MIGSSIWLKPLGWALFHSIWQGAAIYLLCRLCYLFLQRRNQARYLLACSGLSMVFILFACTFVKLAVRHLNPANAGQLFSSDSGMPEVSGGGGAGMNASLAGAQFIAGFENTLPYLVPLYLVLLVFLSARILRSFYNLKNLTDQSRLAIPGKELLEIFKTTTKILGIRRPVQLYYSSAIQSPLTLGQFRPIILIPLAFLSHLSIEQVEAVLYHELFHIKRNDYLFNLLQVALETLFFFNPFSTLLSSMIRAEREHCCDESVLKAGINAFSYASALVCLEENRQAGYKLTLGIRSGSGQLLTRIRRITGNPAPAAGSLYLLVLMATLFGGIVSFAFIARTSHSQQQYSGHPYAVETSDTLRPPAMPTPAPLTPSEPRVAPLIAPPPAKPAASLKRAAPAPPRPARFPEKLKKHPAPPRPPKISAVPGDVPGNAHETLSGPLSMEFKDPDGSKKTITINADTLISPDGEIKISGMLNAAQLKNIEKKAFEQARISLDKAKRDFSARYADFKFQDKLKLDLKIPDIILNEEMVKKMNARLGESIASLNIQKLKLQQEVAVLQELKKKIYKEQHPGK